MSGTDGIGKPDWPGDPAGLEAKDVDFVALGHMLGNTCCWNGRSLRFYSVAQHAVTVCDAVGRLGGLGEADRKTLALHALLGEAWRAWLPDPAGAGNSAKSVEKHRRDRAAVQRVVLEAADADAVLAESWVLALGLRQRMAEAAMVRDLADAGIEFGGQDSGPLFPPLKERVRPMPPDRAAKRWIEALEGLRPAGLRPAALRAAESRAQAPGGET